MYCLKLHKIEYTIGGVHHGNFPDSVHLENYLDNHHETVQVYDLKRGKNILLKYIHMGTVGGIVLDRTSILFIKS